MKPSVIFKHIEQVDPDTYRFTFDFILGDRHVDLSAVATLHDSNAPGRQPLAGRYIEVTGVAPLLAPAIAEAIVRRERGEFDGLTTDNRLMRVIRNPALRLRNARLRRAS